MARKLDTSYHDSLIENKFLMTDEVSFEDAEFNLMFGLIKGNQVIWEQEMEGYLSWQVFVSETNLNLSPPSYTDTTVNMHKCTDADEFFEAKES